MRNGTVGTSMASTSIELGIPSCIQVQGETGAVKVEGQYIVHWALEALKPLEAVCTELSEGSSKSVCILHIYHMLQLEDWLYGLKHNLKPTVTGKVGRNSMELVQSICSSSVPGKAISLAD